MKKIILMACAAVIIAGCSTTSEGTIRKATANSLNLKESEFTISNRQDSASEVKYDVKTNKGQKYNCSFSVAESALNKANCTNAK